MAYSKKPLPEERFYSSRKFMLAIVAIVLITALAVLSTWLPGIQPVISELIGGIIGVLSLYYLGNVANKHVVGKQKTNNKGDQ